MFIVHTWENSCLPKSILGLVIVVVVAIHSHRRLSRMIRTSWKGTLSREIITMSAALWRVCTDQTEKWDTRTIASRRMREAEEVKCNAPRRKTRTHSRNCKLECYEVENHAFLYRWEERFFIQVRQVLQLMLFVKMFMITINHGTLAKSLRFIIYFVGNITTVTMAVGLHWQFINVSSCVHRIAIDKAYYSSNKWDLNLWLWGFEQRWVN